MGLDNPFLQDSGAGLNETLDDRGVPAQVDEESESEDLPDECSAEDLAKQEKEAKITILAISSYGSGKILATPRDLSLKPGTHLPEEDKDHQISAGFVARISGHEFRTVNAWARTGAFFLKLEFHLTGNDLPRFAIRAKVVEVLHEDVSLSGGLGFALRLLKFVKTMDLDGPVSRTPPCLPPIGKGRFHPTAGNERHRKVVGPRRQPRSFYLSDLERLERIRRCQAAYIHSWATSPPIPSSLPSLGDSDDQDSVFSSSDRTEDSMEAPPLTTATTATSWLDADPETPCILGRFPGNFSKACIPRVQRQDQRFPVDPFEEQKMRAEAMYDANGDTTGLVSVMTLATSHLLSDRSASYWYPQQN